LARSRRAWRPYAQERWKRRKRFPGRIRGTRSARIAPPPKRDWIITPQAFERLLAWLDEGRDSDGQAYLQMRHRLVLYFQRKRCLTPDDLADETLHRVTRRLEEVGTITDATPARYCYIVAKFVLLEHLRDPGVRRVRDVDVGELARDAGVAPGGSAPGGSAPDERLFECLERCLSALDPDDRALILEYYRDEQRAKIERRRNLAASLGLTANALAIRACRLRDKLGTCVRVCRADRDEDRFRPIRSRRDE
jgi:DNA-directed RNA polymerase specialized sigma24 family protein